MGDEKAPLLVDRPREVSVRGLVEGRAKEISDLLAVIHNSSLTAGEVTQGKRTLMQRLPRHMRRRAMSHNVKRLPRKNRLMAEGIQMAKVVKKPPSRYHKRRPKRLTELYRKRQNKGPTWLETHIWHAKRFHVTALWGYKIPLHSTARGFRASYRDSKSFCLAQDVSYLSCIQIEGTSSNILNPLSKITNPLTGKSFANKVAQCGGYEVEITVYRPGQYPFGCIGPVKFHWRPAPDSGETIRTAWLWTHPAIHSELVEVLRNIYSLKPHPPVDSVPTYTGSEVTVSLLKDTLIRLRFIGPQAGSLLTEAYDFHPTNDDDAAKLSDETPNGLKAEQTNFWNYLQGRSPGEFRTGTIFGGFISDPRFNRPKKRISQFGSKDCVSTGAIQVHIPNSLDVQFWNSEVRQEASRRKKPDSEVNRALANSLNSLPELPQRVPFLLINQKKDCGRFGGWDLVLPEKWAAPFWISAQFRTARAAGLRESRRLAFETTALSFPFEWPDAVSGAEHESTQGQLQRDKYLRRPWNRRVDFDRANIKHPFSPPWLELVQGWNSEAYPDNSELSEFYVLRDRSLLRKLTRRMSDHNVNIEAAEIELHSSALVPICIETIGKGFPKSGALICLPHSSDKPGEQIREMKQEEEEKMDASTVDDGLGWLEEGIISLNEETEMDMDSLLSRSPKEKVKRKRKRNKETKEAKNARLLKGLSSRSTNVVHFAMRKTIGFATTGDMSFSKGQGRAIGFCSLLALTQIWKSEPVKPLVLYRNLTSKIYRYAKIQIISDQ